MARAYTKWLAVCLTRVPNSMNVCPNTELLCLQIADWSFTNSRPHTTNSTAIASASLFRTQALVDYLTILTLANVSS